MESRFKAAEGNSQEATLVVRGLGGAPMTHLVTPGT